MSPLVDSVSVLAAANAGLGSKNDHDWSALLKSQTRTRLSEAISSANTSSVLLVVVTGTAAVETTVKLVVAVVLPAVASNAWEPVPI